MNQTLIEQASHTPSVSSKRRSKGAGTPSLPVVDISPMFAGNARAKRRVAERLGEAAEEYGFLYIEGHGVEQHSIDAVYAQAASWFQRPLDEKLNYYIGHSKNHRGYVPQSEQGLYPDEGARHYEAFDLALDLPLNDPDVSNGHYLLGPNVWPTQSGFRSTVRSYYKQVSHVGHMMCEAFEMYLNVPRGSLLKAMTKPTSQLRLLHYLENNDVTASADVNMGAHTDYECFTILHQGGPGLQVLNPDNEWVDAAPLDGTFTVNIGDLMETWTNGRLKATLHRVANNGHERYSLPFFVAANYDAVIAPLGNLVPKGQQPAYDAIVAGHHLLGQLLRDFPYLRQRYERGVMKLPFRIPSGNPFELGRLPLEPSIA